MDTLAKRSIKHCLGMIAPFEASDSRREEGQLQFYRFMVSLYQGMYEDPEAYLVFSAPYEKYMAAQQQRENRKKKEKAHVNDSRESTLRNTIQQAIQFYAMYFYHAGLACTGLEEQTGALALTVEGYDHVLEQMSRVHGAEYNEQRYGLLKKLGVSVCERGGQVFISHESQGQAMAGVYYLCKAPESKYRLMNFLRLDYKNAYVPIPTVEDICKTLPPQSVRTVKKLEAYLEGMKIRTKIRPLRGIVSDFKWKVEYSCKGKNICGFYADQESFMLCIYFNHFQNISEFAEVLYEEDPDLFQWFKAQFPERLCKCPNNRRVSFGGEFRRICGLSNRAEVVNPDGEDVEKALYLLKKYRALPL